MKWTRETLELAHKHSIYNRQEILRSRMCGCFYCGETFPPAKLDDALDWTDDYHPETTALCPECWIDAVIGDREPGKVFVSANEGLEMIDEEFMVVEYAIGVAKENTELLDKIKASLKKLKDSGKIDEIIGKYIKAE